MDEYNTNMYSAKKLIFPGEEVFSAANQFLKNSFTPLWDDGFMMTLGWGAVFSVFLLFTIILGVRQKIPLEYTVFSLASFLFYSSFAWGISNARYTFVVFPMYMALSRIKNKLFLNFFIICFVVLLLYFTKIFTSGAWAF